MAMSKASFTLFSLVFVIFLSIECKTNQDCVVYCNVPISRGTGICLGG
ncbi:hypothetical protein RDI58_005536 [Solanum bulbocastanum]|uniref:Uncharacterized protein n=1 Tax=Solanum bulbocastanum TaxID=147425 RepID=A0AAN8U3S8_SOLBU